FSLRLPEYTAKPDAGRRHERFPPPSSDPNPQDTRKDHPHLLPGRPELLPLPRPDRNRRAPDVLLRTLCRPRLYRHQLSGNQRALWRPDAEHASVDGPRHGPDGALAYDAGVLYGRLQTAAGVQLGGRRDPPDPDPSAQLYGLPAALGPARAVGDNRRHQ